MYALINSLVKSSSELAAEALPLRMLSNCYSSLEDYNGKSVALFTSLWTDATFVINEAGKKYSTEPAA